MEGGVLWAESTACPSLIPHHYHVELRADCRWASWQRWRIQINTSRAARRTDQVIYVGFKFPTENTFFTGIHNCHDTCRLHKGPAVQWVSVGSCWFSVQSTVVLFPMCLNSSQTLMVVLMWWFITPPLGRVVCNQPPHWTLFHVTEGGRANANHDLSCNTEQLPEIKWYTHRKNKGAIWIEVMLSF